MIIYYNPDCSKCREAKDLLEAASCEVITRNYLEEPLTEEEIRELLGLLGCGAKQITRISEALYSELFGDREPDEAALIKAIVAYPVLLERPIVVEGSRAVIGRPPRLVLDLVEKSK